MTKNLRSLICSTFRQYRSPPLHTFIRIDVIHFISEIWYKSSLLSHAVLELSIKMWGVVSTLSLHISPAMERGRTPTPRQLEHYSRRMRLRRQSCIFINALAWASRNSFHYRRQKKSHPVPNAAARLVAATRRCDNITPVSGLRELHCLPVRQRIAFRVTLKLSLFCNLYSRSESHYL